MCVVPTLHQQGLVEDMGIMDTAQPAGEDVHEVSLMVNKALQDDGECILPS